CRSTVARESAGSSWSRNGSLTCYPAERVQLRCEAVRVTEDDAGEPRGCEEVQGRVGNVLPGDSREPLGVSGEPVHTETDLGECGQLAHKPRLRGCRDQQ